MASPTITHIAGLEAGGTYAKAVLAREVKFSTLGLTVTHKQKTGGTARLVINNTINPFMFIGQRITVNISDSNFDTAEATITGVDSVNKWVEYAKAGSDVASAAASGTITPTYAHGAGTFGDNNTIPNADDAGAGLNKVMVGGRYCVKFTGLNVFNPGLSDTINKTFKLEFPKFLTGSGGASRVDIGFSIYESGTNKALLFCFQAPSTFVVYYWDGTTKSVATYTGSVINVFNSNTVEYQLFVEFIKDGSDGKLKIFRIFNGATEVGTFALNAGYQINFPVNIGKNSGQTIASGSETTRNVVDLMKLYL